MIERAFSFIKFVIDKHQTTVLDGQFELQPSCSVTTAAFDGHIKLVEHGVSVLVI